MSVPFPTTILKPRPLSWPPRAPSPDTITASFGSATFHMKKIAAATAATTMTMTMSATSMEGSPFVDATFSYGAWMRTAFRLLSKFKGLRGTLLDPFGRSAERKMERELINDYEGQVTEMLANLSQKNHRTAVELASLPERIRGFGHVKHEHLAAVSAERERLLRQLRHVAGVGLAA